MRYVLTRRTRLAGLVVDQRDAAAAADVGPVGLALEGMEAVGEVVR